ncbi:acetyl esterase/lipase [Duganella sp. 1224]|uniref:alpha/beta hydrolase n=1 Tax=Duganella sp. 1224 TaxID=2587052 RepID=UPI0015CCEE85|nr:alpha/beta hydrolase [Duganella sp. 1224]NYE59419.1 acetyl esterase/lipase [Duganella sp. 1224]
MRVLAVVFSMLLAVTGQAHAARDAVRNCFDPQDPDLIRLWDGPAPGAAGDDPCLDIPYLRVFHAAHGDRPGPALLLLAGGGYDHLSNQKEQAPVATYFASELNITTFVLSYRLVQADGTYRYPVPMWDGQRALKLIRHRAQAWQIDPARIGVFGFSAGGHLAATLALHPDMDFGLPARDAVDATSGAADLLGLGYPVISMDPAASGKSNTRAKLLHGYRGAQLHQLEQRLSAQDNVSARTPPVFLFVSMDDQRIDPNNSVMFGDALNAAGVPNETHFFAHGAHGAGLADQLPEERVWPEQFKRWLTRQHFIP